MSDEFAPTRVVLIRHGESKVTVRRLIGGPRTCTGLSPLGRTAGRATPRPPGRTPANSPRRPCCYSSAYPRAIETAEIIASSLCARHPDATPDSESTTPARRATGSRSRSSSTATACPTGTATRTTSRSRRARRSRRSITESARRCSRRSREHRGDAIVVACHGGVIDAAFRYLLRLPQIGCVRAAHGQHVAHGVRADEAGSVAARPLQRRRPSRRAPEGDTAGARVTRWLVVGGGAAGCVIAARLSEVESNDVVLLEAGPDHPRLDRRAGRPGARPTRRCCVPTRSSSAVAAQRRSRTRRVSGSVVRRWSTVRWSSAMPSGCDVRPRPADHAGDRPRADRRPVGRPTRRPAQRRCRWSARAGRRVSAADAYLRAGVRAAAT